MVCSSWRWFGKFVASSFELRRLVIARLYGGEFLFFPSQFILFLLITFLGITLSCIRVDYHRHSMANNDSEDSAKKGPLVIFFLSLAPFYFTSVTIFRITLGDYNDCRHSTINYGDSVKKSGPRDLSHWQVCFLSFLLS